MSRSTAAAACILLTLAWAPQVSAAAVKVARTGTSAMQGLCSSAGHHVPDEMGRDLGPGFEVKNFAVDGTTAISSISSVYVNTSQMKATVAYKPRRRLVLVRGQRLVQSDVGRAQGRVSSRLHQNGADLPGVAKSPQDVSGSSVGLRQHSGATDGHRQRDSADDRSDRRRYRLRSHRLPRGIRDASRVLSGRHAPERRRYVGDRQAVRGLRDHRAERADRRRGRAFRRSRGRRWLSLPDAAVAETAVDTSGSSTGGAAGETTGVDATGAGGAAGTAGAPSTSTGSAGGSSLPVARASTGGGCSGPTVPPPRRAPSCWWGSSVCSPPVVVAARRRATGRRLTRSSCAGRSSKDKREIVRGHGDHLGCKEAGGGGDALNVA